MRAGPYVVERLHSADAPAVLAHLIALSPADRSLRFGAAFDDAAVARYVASIEFDRGVVLGARAPGGALLGIAHVALARGVAELGLSIAGGQRRRGVASALATAALREAERLGAHEFRLHCAADNTGMRRIAVRLKMDVSVEGADVLARRRLQPAPSDALPAVAALAA